MRQLEAASPLDPVSENRPRLRDGDPAPPSPDPAANTAAPISGDSAKLTPARVLSALPQNALNSKGCRCLRPYTNLPAGKCCSFVAAAAGYAPSLSEKALYVEDPPGERLRLRSVLAGDADRP